MTQPSRTSANMLLLGVTLALLYGSLFPLTGWRAPPGSLLQQFLTPVDRVGFGDVVTNVLVYLPLGFLLARRLSGRGAWTRVILAVLIGAALSFAIELMQTCLPKRVPSFYDLMLNTIGTGLGTLFAVNSARGSRLGSYFMAWQTRNCRTGSLASLGLAVAGLWASSQLLPFVPSLDVGNLKQGIKPLVTVLRGETAFQALEAVSYALAVLAIASILRATLLSQPGRSRKIVYFVVIVLACKIVVIGRQLSLEALLGATVGLALFQVLRYLSQRRTHWVAAASLVLLVGVNAVRHSAGATLPASGFNWLPFRGHLAHDLVGLADLLGETWPYCALAFVAMSLLGPGRSWLMIPLTAVVIPGSFVLEWQQQYLPGRLGDITDVLLASLAWLVPWRMVKPSAEPRPRHARRSDITRAPLLPVALVVVAAIMAGTLLTTVQPEVPEERLDESTMPRLAEPRQLPPVRLDDFHLAHPRLPAPTADDLARMRDGKSRYIKVQRDRAKDGRGDLGAALFMAVAEPGSQDLAHLHQRLMALEFGHRGHVQVKPLAIAYDWLHDQWTPAQRASLRDKLVDGCEFIIQVIREQRYSPYNVYLYNSPLQALVACAIASYQDTPRAEPVMRFTYDLWMNRVLPVWRQIMGRNGGWHEGGEYVGIGIGQAVYQLPAMWRRATGIDLFASEPGIRGFLDYLVYRTQPDNTDFRLGDAGFFDRRVGDAAALAMEYRHAAAYSLRGCPQRLEPTSWPWGPLPDDSLCDPTARERLPLTKFFDGLGLLVARSDWDADATYVTFKAGDNYWSHSHLDQGAFTLFKRHPLAIDSGIYGTGYGSDHHMNYAYQTIAHNLVTVTDPEDVVPAPGKNDTRRIANDGGQRRIGSGWGVEAAPLDLEEWTAKREIYHTARVLAYEEGPAHVLVRADLTPAYTNALSGRGTFSHRTRRVERYLRSFLYDRALDLVVIFDRLRVAQPEFEVRWLLHSEGKPILSEHGFELSVHGSQFRSSMQTAGLTAAVVLPQKPQLTALGGPGFEFFVDDRNYDDQGRVQEVRARRRDLVPGEWRVEVQPDSEGTEATFLVFLFPWTDHPRELTEFICNEDEALIKMRCSVQIGDVQRAYEISLATGQISVN